MGRILLCCSLLVLVMMVVAVQAGEKADVVMTTADNLTWGAPPPVFEKGAEFTVVSGDPSKDGLYVVRLKMPAGYTIAPHWHPTDEHVTVLSGTFRMALGDKIDESAMMDFGPGGYGLMAATVHHYAMAKTDCIVQVHGKGPFALTYVNPADDPTQRAAKN